MKLLFLLMWPRANFFMSWEALGFARKRIGPCQQEAAEQMVREWRNTATPLFHWKVGRSKGNTPQFNPIVRSSEPILNWKRVGLKGLGAGNCGYRRECQHLSECIRYLTECQQGESTFRSFYRVAGVQRGKVIYQSLRSESWQSWR